MPTKHWAFGAAYLLCVCVSVCVLKGINHTHNTHIAHNYKKIREHERFENLRKPSISFARA